MPQAARIATSAGLTYVPPRASTAPARTSSPVRRSPEPRLPDQVTSTAAMPWSVPEMGTITSHAAGSSAPEATEMQVPGVSRTGRQLAAERSPTTFSRTGRDGEASAMSSKRAAYPSIAAWS
jgi:hypothetical protein